MADASHFIGKLVFQIEVPDRDKAQSVFEQISSLCADQLPGVLSDILDTLPCPPDALLKIDRLVIHAGSLPPDNIEAELLKNIEQALRKALAATALDTPPPIPGTHHFLDLLEYFLLEGRFPWWATRRELAEKSLESLWAELFLGPGHIALPFLRKMLDQPPARQRIIRQLSVGTLRQSVQYLLESDDGYVSGPALRDIMAALFPGQATEIQVFLTQLASELAKQFPGQPAETLVWRAALQQMLGNAAAFPDIPALWEGINPLIAGALHQSPQAFREQLAPVVAVALNIGGGAASPSAAQRRLYFFLESGRLPEGETASTGELERTLLDLLRQFPQSTRQMLLDLSRKTDLVARLTQQFSVTLQGEVLAVFFPGQAAEIQAFLSQLALSLAEHYPDHQIESRVWQLALRQILANPAALPNIPALWEMLALQLAETLDISPQSLAQKLVPVLEQAGLKAGSVAEDASSATGLSEPDADSAGTEQPLALPEPAARGATDATGYEILLNFLESGQLADGVLVDAAVLEQTFMEFLAAQPDRARRLLLDLNGSINLASRLEQHFSSAVHREVIALLAPVHSAEIDRMLADLAKAAAEIYPSVRSESFIWKTALRYLLAQSGETATTQAIWIYIIRQFAAYLEMPLEQILEQMASVPAAKSMLPGSIAELLYQEKIRTENRREPLEQPVPENVRQLFYFLEWSRMPAGVSVPARQLEPTFLHFLRDNPALARQMLLDINRKVNLASRLIQQFQSEVHREVLRVLFAEEWTGLETVLRDLARLPAPPGQAVPGEAFLWQTGLQRLLAAPARSLNLPALADFLIRQIAEKWGAEPAQLLHRNRIPALHAAGISPLTLKCLQQAFGKLAEAERSTLQREMEQWQEADAGQPGEEAVAGAALDKLLFRMQRDEVAWWDSAAHSTEQLFRELATLPAAALRQALRQLWSGKLREQWLPALSEGTFRQMLRVFWGDYADQAAVYLESFEAAAAAMGLDTRALPLREVLLEYALSGRAVSSTALLQVALRAAVRHSGRPEQQWVAALETQSAAALAGGDIRFYRLREVLREPETEPMPDSAPAATPNTAAPASTETQPAAANYLELLRLDLLTVRRFLRYGTMAPDAGAASPEAMEYLLLRLAAKHPELLSVVFREAFRRRESVDRLMRYFSGKIWAPLAAMLWQSHFEPVMALWNALFSRFDAPDANRMNRHFFHYLLERGGAEPVRSYDPLLFAEDLIGFIAEKEQIPEPYLWEQIQQEKPGAVKDVLHELLPALLKRRKQAARITPEKTRQAMPETAPAPADEAITVHNSGLVILAPYLIRYFDTLHLLEKQAFIDAAAAERGVHLLQYMASRQTQTPEHLLVFNKILCGLPLHTPVSLGIDLTEEEEKLSAFLLNTVLQNWEIMRNSTVANLQGAFILRDGLLREKTDSWQLHIEKKSYDIVLDYLPWTVSMVKLPWMEKRIEVEWKKKF